jgi:hypothetical protein
MAPRMRLIRAERRGDRHLAAKAEIREETEDRERSDVPGRRNKAGKQCENADCRRERGTPSDIIGHRSPKQCADEGADKPDRGH